MCLGVPGLITEISNNEALGVIQGKVKFGGIIKDVNLSYTPEAKIGDYVVVHVGFAISLLKEDEARQVFEYLEAMGGLKELEAADS